MIKCKTIVCADCHILPSMQSSDTRQVMVEVCKHNEFVVLPI